MCPNSTHVGPEVPIEGLLILILEGRSRYYPTPSLSSGAAGSNAAAFSGPALENNKETHVLMPRTNLLSDACGWQRQTLNPKP